MLMRILCMCLVLMGLASWAEARTTAQTRTAATTRTVVAIDRHADASHLLLSIPRATGFLTLETGGGWFIIEPQASQRSVAQ